MRIQSNLMPPEINPASVRYNGNHNAIEPANHSDINQDIRREIAMLEELRIQNFAIIDQLELTFSAGFNVITGETGAGKSIIIDAVELLLGGKAETGSVRAGADKAVIEGVFTVDSRIRAKIMPLLQAEDLLDADDPMIEAVTLTREVRSTGRSSARINGISVKADLLREVGGALVDIHGQSTHLSLFRPRAHIDLLDRFAELFELREALSTIVNKLGHIRGRIRVLEDDKEALKRRADRLRYEVEEIEAAGLDPNEEESLAAERSRLANSEQIATLSQQIVVLLSGDEADDTAGAVDQLMQVAALMARLERIDPELAEDATLATELSTSAQELAITMAGYVDEIEFSPSRLDELEERLELIKTLKRRYRVSTIADIIAYADNARQELETLEHSEEALNKLRAEEDDILHQIGDLAQRMSRTRQAAGELLGQQVVTELKDLRMENTQFEVIMAYQEDPNGCYVGGKRYAFDGTGIDQLEFMMSANPGEPLRPLAKVASGGEAARIMLALKRVLTQADETPLLIFDEIDQGIGGRIGAIVGEKLWSLSVNHQVMVVTHLPQLAGYGDNHYRVQKQVKKKRTATNVTSLTDDEQRVDELAAMLGAQGESGRESAREILQAARVRKQELSPTHTPQQPNLL